jgi:hypothetical protein
MMDRRSWWALVVAVALVAGAGCKRGGERLVSDEEIEALRARTLAAAAASAERRCERPVLRGEAVDGPADEAIAAAATLAGPLAGCAEALGDEGSVLDEIAPAPDGEERGPRRATPLGEEAGPREQAVVAACEGLPAAVTRAVAHRDACSPFAPGRGAMPGMLPFLRGSHAVAAHMRSLARAGEVLEAVRHGLDHVRLQQDLTRGGTWLHAMVAAGAFDAIAPQLELLLHEPALDAEALAVIAAELQSLVATEVHVAEILAGEALYLDLYMMLPHFQPEDWEPPGGWPDDMGPPSKVDDSRVAKLEVFSVDARDDAALSWLAADEIGRDHRQACPPDTSFAACAAGIERVAVRHAEAAGRVGTADPKKPVARRAAAIAVLKGTASPRLATYVGRHARRTAMLAALRVLVEARRAEACPAASAYDEEPLATARRSARLEEPLEVRAGEGGAVELWAPAWMHSEHDAAAALVRVRCEGWAGD